MHHCIGSPVGVSILLLMRNSVAKRITSLGGCGMVPGHAEASIEGSPEASWVGRVGKQLSFRHALEVRSAISALSHEFA